MKNKKFIKKIFKLNSDRIEDFGTNIDYIISCCKRLLNKKIDNYRKEKKLIVIDKYFRYSICEWIGGDHYFYVRVIFEKK
jgi:hypothetical protein